ncbi:hypothetical protein [Aggregatibacter aphrophilus]|jgi:hypothetical protein|uniref:Uncharacterized protein n=2 Tax=Aggregatibacter aphrophilus TaxID=732 RepID=A0A336N3W0_AGGAP|nr:hypothetical protein [Aggregatibacter aphrophilus]EHB91094.1 hypothetical protein HMPREF9335_00784 [Aggregatibacter aphrophilus F0387]ACS97723.1 lipoprotein, putative [Aggregatibacter aphrophilus NJ8700]SQI97026.1 Uncharacterised protein [Aggregatibacter aphrophilus]SSY93653.1 Uncharacterised protein [Aggregatibacter aphrophilus]VEF44681.1 Uncharacterised protein [Aggregatibacter aphrophilus ATCC 33389]
MANIQKDVIVVGGGMIGVACTFGFKDMKVLIEIIRSALRQ